MIRQHQLIGGAIALAAALIVSAAPAALGDPAPLAKAEAVPSAGSGAGWESIPKPDRIAAERAAANKSASLDRFALIHVRAIPPTATAPTAAVQPNADEQTPVAAANGYVVRAQTAAISSTPVPPILPTVKASQLAKIEQGEPSAYTPPRGARYSNAEFNAYATTAPPHITAGVARVATPQDGFEWGDAGIGAGVGFVLAVLGLGGALVLSQRRPRRGRHATALTS